MSSKVVALEITMNIHGQTYYVDSPKELALKESYEGFATVTELYLCTHPNGHFRYQRYRWRSKESIKGEWAYCEGALFPFLVRFADRHDVEYLCNVAPTDVTE